jgi:hypothetical protein
MVFVAKQYSRFRDTNVQLVRHFVPDGIQMLQVRHYSSDTQSIAAPLESNREA